MSRDDIIEERKRIEDIDEKVRDLVRRIRKLWKNLEEKCEHPEARTYYDGRRVWKMFCPDCFHSEKLDEAPECGGRTSVS